MSSAYISRQEPHHTSSREVFVVEDDPVLRQVLRDFLELHDLIVEDFANAEAFLASSHAATNACLLMDLELTHGMDGLDLLKRLKDSTQYLPTVVITGCCSVPRVVQAMKLGAEDLIQKPISPADLLSRITSSLEHSCSSCTLFDSCIGASDRLARLTKRQEQILDLVVAGRTSKDIAADIGISQRIVELHRSIIRKKTGAKSLPELALLTTAAKGVGLCGRKIQRQSGIAFLAV